MKYICGNIWSTQWSKPEWTEPVSCSYSASKIFLIIMLIVSYITTNLYCICLSTCVSCSLKQMQFRFAVNFGTLSKWSRIAFQHVLTLVMMWGGLMCPQSVLIFLPKISPPDQTLRPACKFLTLGLLCHDFFFFLNILFL